MYKLILTLALFALFLALIAENEYTAAILLLIYGEYKNEVDARKDAGVRMAEFLAGQDNEKP